MTPFRHPISRNNGGFSLIEVLIALVILSVGLLGIAAMVSISLKSKDSSYYRTQALALSGTILDRMRANRATAVGGGYNNAPTASPNCTGSAATCSTTDIANMDLSQWQNDLNELLSNGGNAPTYTITTVPVNQMTQVQIHISWYDSRASQALAAPGGSTTAAAAPATSSITITSGL